MKKTSFGDDLLATGGVRGALSSADETSSMGRGRDSPICLSTERGKIQLEQNAGFKNTTGSQNGFFGNFAGFNNTTGGNNAFFGSGVGSQNTTAVDNAFFGGGAGASNTTGDENTFVGGASGSGNTTGSRNTFIGKFAGFNSINPTGDGNTLLGAYARANSGVSNATAIGSRALVMQSNSLVLGSINGMNGAPADTNVGIGTNAAKTKLHVTNGKIYVEANGQGVILKSPGGVCFELTVTDAGALTTAVVACP